MSTGKSIVFYCATSFQLFNILNMIASDEFQFDSADLVLDNASPLEKYIPGLQETGAFRRILQNDSISATAEYKALPIEKRKALSHHPDELICIEWDNPDYTDVYMANAWALHKLVYYSLVQKECRPAIHLYEDGTATYAMDLYASYATEGIDHEFYQQAEYKRNLVELMLYQPTLFTGKVPCAVNSLPVVDRRNERLQKMCQLVFDHAELPNEKYIFFEEASAQDLYPCNDFELFEMIAHCVGKDNIIVKRHPRNRTDRFTPAGYKVMPHQTVPWEVCLLQNPVLDKVLITITSGACMTPKLIFGEAVDSIHLVRMLQGFTPTTYHPQFFTFQKQVLDWSNAEETNVFQPSSSDELKEILKYINARRAWKGGKRV